MEETKKVLDSKKKSIATIAWQEYGRELEQKTPERLEDAAKFLAGMISITLTLFANTLRKDALVEATPLGLKIIGGIWLLSLLLAFAVIFPLWYRYNEQSAESVKLLHRKVVKTKYILLLSAVLLFLLALGMILQVYLFSK